MKPRTGTSAAARSRPIYAISFSRSLSTITISSTQAPGRRCRLPHEDDRSGQCAQFDAEALINDPEVDAVYTATPPSSDKDDTLLTAQAGKPVYVEKPMALNVAECHVMLQACQAACSPVCRLLPPCISSVPQGERTNRYADLSDVRCVTLSIDQPPAPNELSRETLP